MQIAITGLVTAALAGVVTLVVEPVNREATTKELTQLGYVDIEIVGWAPLLCDEWSIHATEYIAKNENDERVHGVRCVGKNGRVRHLNAQEGIDD